jgi:hypothetical protein
MNRIFLTAIAATIMLSSYAKAQDSVTGLPNASDIPVKYIVYRVKDVYGDDKVTYLLSQRTATTGVAYELSPSTDNGKFTGEYWISKHLYKTEASKRFANTEVLTFHGGGHKTQRRLMAPLPWAKLNIAVTRCDESENDGGHSDIWHHQILKEGDTWPNGEKALNRAIADGFQQKKYSDK